MWWSSSVTIREQIALQPVSTLEHASMVRLSVLSESRSEYGGGAYTLTPDGGLVFANFSTQQLLLSFDPTQDPLALTPEDSAYRFADLSVDAGRGTVLAVREDHSAGEDPATVVNTVTSVALDGSHSMTVLAEGRDFYMSPRLSPDGSQIAYVCYDHPNMPWDDTELWVADASTGQQAKLLAGGPNESVMEPVWAPDGSALFFISDSTDYWNLYMYGLASGTVTPVFPVSSELGGPSWMFGDTSYAFVAPDKLAMTYTDSGSQRLIVLELEDPIVTTPFPFNVESPQCVHIEGAVPACVHSIFSTSNADHTGVIILGGAPDTPESVVHLSLLGDHTVQAHTLQQSFDPVGMAVDLSGFISTPTETAFPTMLPDGTAVTAYANVYLPMNRKFQGLEGSKPPCLVKIHGGPTSAASKTLRLDIQYWTSRGFCVADVNYGGSTGYGRKYRERLRGTWGLVDVADCCAIAEHLAATGVVDPEQLCIDGGSAGGYTTLCALCFKDTFRAGCSKYGVSDLSALAQETHKFESRYLDRLVAPYPEGVELYNARSPIHHVDGLNCPILILQGDEDKIVPPNQACMMHDAVKAKGIPTCLIMFQGEQHGFRQARNIKLALEAELGFYGLIFGFTPADHVVPLEVDNM